MLIVPPFMLQLGWVHVRVLSTREGQWGLFGGLWVCIVVNHPLTEPPVPTGLEKHILALCFVGKKNNGNPIFC